ncbi:replication initiator protein [robinz microvirus RP_152]|nr:replication initiator protein [robinz microvirus RP_152]
MALVAGVVQGLSALATVCRNPFVSAGVPYPCGQCDPCRHSRRRVWAHRLMLEAMCHEESAFVTLTYTDDQLVLASSGEPTLCPEHYVLWLKRLRERVAPAVLRFYIVGEYGDRTNRPHYHCMLFGFPTCSRGRTYRTGFSLEPVWRDCCDRCRLVGDTWKLGNVDLGQVTKDSSGYIAGYVMKKLNRFDDPRLNGRNPEFARMSNRPGIGADFMHEVASDLMKYQLDTRIDVPLALGHARKQMPLGRYLRGKLREAIGHDCKAPQAVLDAMAAELLPVREVAFASSGSLKEAVIRAGDGPFANFSARQAIYKKGRSL